MTLPMQWIDRWNDQHRSISLKKLLTSFWNLDQRDSAKHRLSPPLHDAANSANLHKTKVQQLGQRMTSRIVLEKLPPASYNAHL